MSSENSSVVTSNDLQSTKPDIHGKNGQISQIPGLSPTITTGPAEKVQGRRTRVLDSDSDYVKLAKQGGHKGLLWYDESITSKANSYKPPDCFNTASEEDSKLYSPINDEEKKNPGAFKPLEPPFWSDRMSAWERGHSSSSKGKEKNDNVHSSQMENLPSTNQFLQTNNFKRIVFDKKPAPVDMSKLLSFGYAEDDKPSANTDLSNEKTAAAVENDV